MDNNCNSCNNGNFLSNLFCGNNCIFIILIIFVLLICCNGSNN